MDALRPTGNFDGLGPIVGRRMRDILEAMAESDYRFNEMEKQLIEVISRPDEMGGFGQLLGPRVCTVSHANMTVNKYRYTCISAMWDFQLSEWVPDQGGTIYQNVLNGWEMGNTDMVVMGGVPLPSNSGMLPVRDGQYVGHLEVAKVINGVTHWEFRFPSPFGCNVGGGGG